MSRPPKYPLDALEQVRAKAVEASAQELAEKVRERERAEAAHRAAEAEKARVAAQASATRQAEAQRLAAGELTVADLARADAWEIAARAEEQRKREEAERAATVVQGAHDAEEEARGALATTKADADVVEKDHARWNDREKKRVLQKEEEAAEEAWRKR